MTLPDRTLPALKGSLGLAVRVCILAASIWVPMAHGASPKPGKVTEKTLDSLKVRLGKGPNRDLVALDMARSAEPAYVPLLAEAFAESKNDADKLHFSHALVRLGEKDTAYSNFMQRRVSQILKMDIPYPRTIDANNRLAGYTKEFLEWCRQQKMDTAQAEMFAIIGYPKDFLLLVLTADPRNADILLKGLHARNVLIAILSAKGLARLGDARFEKSIIEAIESRPLNERKTMATVLVYFDSPEARRMADMYVQPKELLDALRSQRDKVGLKGIFGS